MPPDVLKVLEKGPTFASEAAALPQELISPVRNVAGEAGEVNRERCILEGVESLPRGPWAPKSKPNVGKVVSFCLGEGKKFSLLTRKESMP